MDFRTNQILITGALGGVGTRLVEVLLRGLPDCPGLSKPPGDLRLRCLVRPGESFMPLARLSDRIRIVVGDLRNPADSARLCAGAEGSVLFHLARNSRPRRVAELRELNRDGTTNLLEAAIKAGVRRAVVLASSAVCSDGAAPGAVLDEASPCNPRREPGRSELAKELAVTERAEKLGAVVIRAPETYGPYQALGRTQFFKRIIEGKVPLVGDGQSQHSVVFIDNLCQGLLLAATVERAAGQTYWIADPRPCSRSEMADKAERLLETEFSQPCVHQRRRWPGAAGSAANLLDGVLQSFGLFAGPVHDVAESNQPLACSPAKAVEELGYEPKVELEEGLRRALRACISELASKQVAAP